MRFLTLTVLLALARPVAAQDVPTGLTFATGYATGYEAGAIHTEARVRFASVGKVGLEPMVSWTQGLAYDADIDPHFCIGDSFSYSCGPSRTAGERSVALGTALTYRSAAGVLSLGLDAHAGVFGQMALPFWSEGQRYGVELGVAVPVGPHARLGLDVQTARLTRQDRTSVSPLLRLAVGR